MMSIRAKGFLVAALIVSSPFIPAASQAKKAAAIPINVADLFASNCAACHGADGKGAKYLPDLPDFTDPKFHRERTDARMISSITNGRGAMPSFQGKLRSSEIRELARYVRRFSKSSGAKAGDGLIERALRGEARIIDLSHPLTERTPTFGGERDAFRYEKLADMSKDGYASGAFRTPEHFGTHVDSPGHFIAGKETVDRIEARKLIAPAAVIDVRAKVKNNPDYRLTADDIRAWEKDGPLPESAAVLLLTGWDSRWNDAEKYRNVDSSGVMHFPGFSVEAIEYLLKKPRIVALGIDTLSIDYGPSKDFAGHKLSHAAGLYHIENMTGLDKLPARGAVLFVAPLAIEGGSGSPARVLAVAPPQ